VNALDEADLSRHVHRNVRSPRSKDGAYACVSLWEGYGLNEPHKMAIHDGTKSAEKSVSLLKGVSQEFPPYPAEVQKFMKENPR